MWKIIQPQEHEGSLRKLLLRKMTIEDAGVVGNFNPTTLLIGIEYALQFSQHRIVASLTGWGHVRRRQQAAFQPCIIELLDHAEDSYRAGHWSEERFNPGRG